MITIKQEYNEKQIQKIIIDGHAGYDIRGKDIVCASVSSIVTTSVNMLIRLDEKAISYDVTDGHLEIQIFKHTELIDMIIENMVSLFQELEEQYKKYIKIVK